MTEPDTAALLAHVATLWPNDKSTTEQRRVFAQHCKPLGIPGPRAREIADREFLAKPRGFTPWAELASSLKSEADRILAETRRLQSTAPSERAGPVEFVSAEDNARDLADAVEWVREQPPGSLVKIRERMRESDKIRYRGTATHSGIDWADAEELAKYPGTCRCVRDFATAEGVTP